MKNAFHNCFHKPFGTLMGHILTSLYFSVLKMEPDLIEKLIQSYSKQNGTLEIKKCKLNQGIKYNRNKIK